MVRQTEIRIAPETTGRLASIAVSPGQHVARGDLLAVLDNPDLAALVGEAKAAAVSAKADRDRVYSGVRAEEVAIATEAVRTAEANLLLAQQQNVRAVTLSAENFASRQTARRKHGGARQGAGRPRSQAGAGGSGKRRADRRGARPRGRQGRAGGGSGG